MTNKEWADKTRNRYFPTVEPESGVEEALRHALDRLESVEAQEAGLREALKELVYAAWKACDWGEGTRMRTALDKADTALSVPAPQTSAERDK